MRSYFMLNLTLKKKKRSTYVHTLESAPLFPDVSLVCTLRQNYLKLDSLVAKIKMNICLFIIFHV